MKKIIAIISMCMLQSIQLCAQQLYLIRATVDENYSFGSPPPVQLIRYNPMEDTVLSIVEDYTKLLSPPYRQLSSIIYYPILHSVCFTIRFHSYFLLNTNRPDTLLELIPQCPSNYQLPSDIGIVNNYWSYECFNNEAFEKKNVFLHKGTDSSLTHHFDISPHEYRNIYIRGITSQRIVLKPNDKYMYLPIIADTINRPVFSVELPQKYWVNKKTFKAIQINDEIQTLLTMGRSKSKNKNDYGIYYGAVYNKKKDKWFDIELKGNATNVQAWGHWFAGAVIVGTRENMYFQNISSPGKAVRDSVYMECSFDEMAQNYGFYRPGILYLFNTDTEKYIEWDTRQGDSEILLVQDEVVYYRVFDTIYKVSIENGEKLGQAELLVKDNQIVPYIHWAFFGQ
jgi:hypothetical protein